MAENIEKLILDDTEFINPLTDVIKKLEQTEKAVKEMNGVAQKEMQKTATEAAKSAKVQEESMKSVITTMGKGSEAYKKHAVNVTEIAMAISKTALSGDKLKTLFSKLESVKLGGAKADISDVEKEFTDLLSTVELTEDQVKFLTDNIEEVSRAVLALESQPIQEIADKAETLTKEFTSAKQELRALTNAINSGELQGDDLKIAQQRAAELTDTIGDNSEQIKKLASDTKGLDTLIEGTRLVAAGFAISEGAAALFGDENEDLQKALVKLNAIMAISNGLQEAHALLLQNSLLKMRLASAQQAIYTTVVGASTGAMKVFRIALASTGIGALVLGLIALITNFDDVKKAVVGMFPILDKLGSIFAGIKEVFIDTFSGIGTLISNIVKGNFSEVLTTFRDLGKNAAESFNEGFAANEAQKVRDAMAKDIEMVVKNQKKKLDILEAGGKDTYELQKTILGNELAALKLYGKDKEEIENKAHELAVLNAEREKELADKREAAAREAAERRKEALDKFREILNTLKEEQGKGLEGEELFNFEKSKAIEFFQNLNNELIKVGNTLGVDVNKYLMEFDNIIQQLEQREFVGKQVEQLPREAEKVKKGLKAIEKVVSDNPVEIPAPKFAEGAGGEFTSEIEKFFEDVVDFDSLIDKLLGDIFGPDSPKAKEFLQGVATFVSEFGAILNESTELQINSIDKQLDALSERRNELEADLEKELDLQEKGLANNVNNKKAEVEGILAQEKKLEAERDKLQKESQRRQIIADSITQGQSLITASINIIKGFSNIPIVGLPLGIAAAATLFGFFVKTKADALKATRLYTGAEKIRDHFGYAARYGETDLPGRGAGYRLINEKTGQPTNVIISGREMLLPENVSLSNSEFFHSLKNGLYSGVDLNAAVGFYMNYHKQAKSTTAAQSQTKVITKEIVKNGKMLVPYSKNGKTGAVLIDVKNDWKDGHFIEIDL